MKLKNAVKAAFDANDKESALQIMAQLRLGGFNHEGCLEFVEAHGIKDHRDWLELLEWN